MFDIRFIRDEVEVQEDGWRGLRGQIALGNDSEEFMSSVASWSRQQYEAQWIEAAARLLAPEGRAGFFTSAFQFWWVMWRFGPNVYAREQAFMRDTLAKIADRTRAPYELIEDHSMQDPNCPASEWVFSASEVSDFLKSRGGGPAI